MKKETVIKIDFPETKALPIKNEWKRREFIVTHDYHIYIPSLELWCRIPRNFVFDFASIPRVIPISPTGILAYGAVVHDFIYRFGKILVCDSKGGQYLPLIVSRKLGDQIFRELNLIASEFAEAGKSRELKIEGAYCALRWFGAVNYKCRPLDSVDWSQPVCAG